MSWNLLSIFNRYKKNFSRLFNHITGRSLRSASEERSDLEPRPQRSIEHTYGSRPGVSGDAASLLANIERGLKRCDYFWKIQNFPGMHIFDGDEAITVTSNDFKLYDQDGLDVNFALYLSYDERSARNAGNVTIGMCVKYASCDRWIKAKVLVMDEQHQELIRTSRNIRIVKCRSVVRYCTSLFDADMLEDGRNRPPTLVIIRLFIVYYQDQSRLQSLSGACTIDQTF